jgi:hypothetical protein
LTAPLTARHASAAFLFLLSLCFALLTLSCSEDSSVQPPVTVTKLALLAAFPANGSTGPFDLYTPNANDVKAHFYVRFNHTMDLNTFTTKKITCEGFDVPVLVKVLYHYPSDGDVVGFSVVRNIAGQTAPPKMTYRVNATYTVAIDSTVADLAGNQLGTKYKFSFTPEPYFRVVSYSFTDGDTTNPTSLELFFNSRLSSAANGAISVSPSLNTAWAINESNDSCSTVCDVYGKVVPSSLYSISVAPTVADYYGNIIHAGATKSFATPSLTVESNKFPDGILSVNLATQFTMKFNYPMDTASLRSAFAFSPAAGIALSIGQNALTFYAPDDFAPNTDYQIHLSTQAKTVSGYMMQTPLAIAFRTANFTYKHIPVSNETGVMKSTVIEIIFTGAINADGIDSAITVTPPFSHHIQIAQDFPGKSNHIYYIQTYPLAGYTKYTVRVSNTVHSIAGYTMAQPDSFSFTTGVSKK